jgi:hypothetical protein
MLLTNIVEIGCSGLWWVPGAAALRIRVPRFVLRYWPSFEKAIASTESVWPSRVCRHWPVVGSQSHTVQSSDADARVFPSFEKAIAYTESVWPSRAK